jgi:hypothetical protein
MIKVVELSARCSSELAIISGEETVRFIALFILFDRAPGPTRGDEGGQPVLKNRFNSAAWVVSAR